MISENKWFPVFISTSGFEIKSRLFQCDFWKTPENIAGWDSSKIFWCLFKMAYAKIRIQMPFWTKIYANFWDRRARFLKKCTMKKYQYMQCLFRDFPGKFARWWSHDLDFFPRICQLGLTQFSFPSIRITYS